jgi:hypothetical protein
MSAAPKAPHEGDVAGMSGRLVDLAGRLVAVLSRETALVRAMRVREIGPLQDEKTSLTAQYRTAFKAMTSTYPGSSLPAPIKEELAISGQHLGQALVENELALRVGKAATERLITSIVAAVRQQKKFRISYAPQRETPRHTFMTAAAVDRRL